MGGVGSASGGVRLHVEVDNPGGTPLLLLNGARCTTRTWDAVVPALADAGFTVLRHDVRGTGQSGGGDPAEYRLECYADDAVGVLDSVCGPDAGAMVWSMAFGSRVGLMLAERHPTRVRAAALYDASVDLPNPEEQKAGAAVAKQRRAEMGWPEPERDPAWHAMADPETAALAYGAARVAGRLDHLLADVRCPVLIATGEHDPNLASSRDMVKRLADAELVILERTGHGSVLQRPERCVEVFLEWAGRKL